ncbi:glycosyltransferase, partial [Bradyrhizobium sp. NBAIM08]|uniref:glycosyltransferase n=1 Tax=Bradyrhizobium sp. NBAIM08 TaxID=2793815 RepID=UPI001CD2133F
RSRLVVAVVGGPSGSSGTTPVGLQRLAGRLGIGDLVRFIPPATHAELVHWYRAASVTVVPSYSESFGLVAVESQACGTPVVAATVGGLPTAVRDGQTGLLVPNQDPRSYAAALGSLVSSPRLLAKLGSAARGHAEGFGWPAT